MKIKKKCVAMLLAGGQGSRLYALTQKVAKPAIPYGGKNRFIDFPLSNCINSGIDTVGVLTQYQPMVLNEYIGNGQPWDLDKMHGGVHVLPQEPTYSWFWRACFCYMKSFSASKSACAMLPLVHHIFCKLALFT